MDKKTAVLITGGVRNTGLLVAEKFLSEGKAVFITSRDESKAERKAKELKEKYNVDCFGISYLPVDAKKSAPDMFQTISGMGYLIDTLVCVHADPGLHQNALCTDLTDWENVVLSNVLGSYMPARMMAKTMVGLGSNGGSIVFLGSTVAASVVPNRSAYVASKGALESMARALSLDFAKLNIRVNCVVPGPIETDRWNANTVSPVSKPVAPKQVANAVWFLAAPASCGITGTTLVVDNGLDCIVPGAY